MTGLAYALVCPLAYLLAGSLKFAVNSVKAGELAYGRIGLGGFPSTHTAIVSSAAWLIALRAGIDNPTFGVAMALLLIVVIDAMDLRRKLERVNRVLKSELPNSAEAQQLRDRVGHTPVEVAGGLIVGGIAAVIAGALAP